MSDWLNKWKRSAPQDRRVQIDGVFYEQVPPHIMERAAQSDLEAVQNETNHGGNRESHAAEVKTQEAKDGQAASAGTDELSNQSVGSGGSDAAGTEQAAGSDSLGANSLVATAPDTQSVSEALQAELEPLPAAVLPEGGLEGEVIVPKSSDFFSAVVDEEDEPNAGG